MQNYKGLSSLEAEKILLRDGANRLAERKKAGLLSVFLGQFKDIMVLILLAATAFSLIMGELWDAVIIIIIVILNACLGFFQEYRTEKTLEALKKIAAPTARVFRDGSLITLPAEKIVKGDIIKLEAGGRVPADCRVIELSALECDESMLTGESVSVTKTVAAQSQSNALHQPNVCYMGTIVTKGHAAAEIIATGKATQMGLISALLLDIEPEKTPLQKRLSELGKIMGISCLAVCFLVSLCGILRGFGLFDMIFTGISLAVAAIPEGLPATVTISLALAVRRIYKQKALVNKLHAVETLGCTNVICTDKTGTLTQNKMSVTAIFTDRIAPPDKSDNHRERLLYLCGALCNNALKQPDKTFTGDPTETALMVSAVKAGVHTDGYKRIHEIPFDSAARFMAVTVKADADNGNAQIHGASVWLKGAPDAVFNKCGFIMQKSETTPGYVTVPLTEKHKRNIFAAVEDMAAKALRILGFAYKPEGYSDYIFLGLQGLQDPLRPEVRSAVKKCRNAGIRVVMLTGDHKNTASEIASQAGILSPPLLNSFIRRGAESFDFENRLNGNVSGVCTGTEIAKMSDEELRNAVQKTAVFARVSPSDKLRIVRAFKSLGAVVAMTGDGVNDAPAVKEASIGAAMGITGTDVTKEAAQIILLDDNFATLVSAVEQGRTIYNNIRKFVRYMLSCNIGEIITMLFAMLLGMPAALLPIQILLINLVTDGLPAIALGMEPPDEGVMKKPPRKSDESIFAGNLLLKILTRGLGIGIFTLLTFYAVLQTGSLAAARTAALATLGLSQLIFVFECKAETAPESSSDPGDCEKGLFGVCYKNNPKLIIAVLISFSVILCVMLSGVASPVFKTAPLDFGQILTVVGLSAGYPVLKGILKYIGRGGRN
ncbi:MAG: cation-translocating P-type ATPase [Oscillospiraceae bacterium]|nr:cation-translocating P-type ATPase [Oscillospiraceae bacterium]